MRSRTLFRAAVSTAAVGLAAFGTVVAQQPQPGRVNPAPGGTPPVTTVRPYSEWTPTAAPPGYTPKQPGVVQAGGVLPLPPGYISGASPAGMSAPGNKGRLTSPVVAGPDGVRPAGGFDLPPPNLDIPAFRAGATPPAAAPTDPNHSKFAPLPIVTDPKPPVPVVPPVGGTTTPPPFLPPGVGLPAAPAFAPPAAPAVPAPAGPAPLVPVPPSVGGPAALPPVGPSAPVTPPVAAPIPQPANVPPVVAAPTPPPVASPTVPMVVTPAAPAITTPTAPAVTTPTAPAVVTPAAPAITTPTATPVAGATTPAATPTPTSALPPRTTPSVVVETICPETVSFGQEYQYKVIVRNGGTANVAHVRVENEIPAGARFVACEPQGELNGDHIVWSLGALDAGAERHLTVKVKAGDEGEARTRASVTFTSAVAARTHVTRPRLATTVRGPESARAGDEAVFRIQVTNSGSGPANRVLVQATLSDGLYHPQAQKGGLIEAELPMVKAGEVRTVELKLGAAKAGLQNIQIVTGADGSPDATAKAAMNVVEPMLVVRQTGPGKCLVGGNDPSFDIDITNPGTAATDPVQVHTVLPDGFDFATASDGGAVVSGGRTVSWKLPSLQAGGTKKVTLRLRATVATDGAALRTVAQSVPAEVTQAAATTGAGGVNVRAAGRGLEARAESMIAAEGVAAIRFDVTGLENPVTVGREATYEVKVMNRGTGACHNVQLVAVLADGTEFVGATAGATNQAAAVRAAGQQITFEPIAVLGVRNEQVFRVRVKANAPGELRFRVQLTSDQLRTPLVKEESTTFYMEQR